MLRPQPGGAQIGTAANSLAAPLLLQLQYLHYFLCSHYLSHSPHLYSFWAFLSLSMSSAITL